MHVLPLLQCTNVIRLHFDMEGIDEVKLVSTYLPVGRVLFYLPVIFCSLGFLCLSIFRQRDSSVKKGEVL